nr:cation transporter [uncultured Campylobacter sp.]
MMDFKDGKREKTIIKTALIGIVTNFFLAAAKIFIAMVSNSVALISDAVNNLSDAGSSIITIFGSKLASKIPGEAPPLRLRQDRVYRRSHCFGYSADAGILVSKNLRRKHLRARAHQLYDAVFSVFVLRDIRQICAWLLLQKDRPTDQIYLA